MGPIKKLKKCIAKVGGKGKTNVGKKQMRRDYLNREEA
jgi:hypothetical protein